MSSLGQHANIKFCVLLEKSPSETLEMLEKPFGNDAMKKTVGQKFRLDKSRGKVMLEVFFDYDSVIHYEFIPEGQTVNKELYVEILKRLRDAIGRKRPEKWATND
ncbi:hypothetical protein AVEN_206886-1 [Araneus ventricosus]|uniref:Uncharacterized protein n=1 Tax=Araneus ventricosus TaxID=182803 RepID=A0A4Y2Q083_ARAVE|nr:hypothetical protein AVEN_206886-1 [Araneus ventricosus]